MKYKLSIALLCASGSALCMDEDAQWPTLQRSLTPRTAFFTKVMTTERMGPAVWQTLSAVTRKSLANAAAESPTKVQTLITIRKCVEQEQGYANFDQLSDLEKHFALIDVVRVTLEDKKREINQKIQALSNEAMNSNHLDADLSELRSLQQTREPLEALERELLALPLTQYVMANKEKWLNGEF